MLPQLLPMLMASSFIKSPTFLHPAKQSILMQEPL